MKNLPDIKEVMEHEGVKLVAVASGNYRAICPLCFSSGKSLVVKPHSQTFNCQCCHKGGDVLRFITLLKRESFWWAAQYIKKLWGGK